MTTERVPSFRPGDLVTATVPPERCIAVWSQRAEGPVIDTQMIDGLSEAERCTVIAVLKRFDIPDWDVLLVLTPRIRLGFIYELELLSLT